MSKKQRLDALMVTRTLAPNRSKAKAFIMAGVVVVDDHVAEKAGQLVRDDSHIRLKDDFIPYVSRGGMKLQGGLDAFGIDPTDAVCIDVGASTGGFTDCLLQRGAAKVFAVDVGYGQLAWKLREDPRVVNIERQNIRYLDPAIIGDPVDLIVADASFISLALILPKMFELLRVGGDSIVLVKPQFEVEKGQVGKGGVIRDPELRL